MFLELLSTSVSSAQLRRPHVQKCESVYVALAEMFVRADKRHTRARKAVEREFDSVSMTSSGSLGSEATDADPFEEMMDQLRDSKYCAPRI